MFVTFYVKWNITFVVRYCKVVLKDRDRGRRCTVIWVFPHHSPCGEEGLR